MNPDDITARLREFIAQQAGAFPVEIENVRRLAGGASREIWSLDVALGRRTAEVELELLNLIDEGLGTGG